MKKHKIITSIAIAISALSGASAATAYSNQAAYDAAVGPQQFLIDFNGSPGAMVDGSTISPNVVFSSPEAANPANVLWSSDALSDGGSTTAPNGVGPLRVDFNTSSYGFALLFSSAGNAPTVELYDSSNALLGSVLAPNVSGFFGVSSASPIDHAIIRPGLLPNNNPDRFFIDDFRANRPGRNVPDQTSSGLTALAFVASAVGAMRVKKARN